MGHITLRSFQWFRGQHVYQMANVHNCPRKSYCILIDKYLSLFQAKPSLDATSDNYSKEHIHFY